MKLCLQLVIKLAPESLPALEWRRTLLFFPHLNPGVPWSLKTAALLGLSTSHLPSMQNAPLLSIKKRGKAFQASPSHSLDPLVEKIPVLCSLTSAAGSQADVEFTFHCCWLTSSLYLLWSGPYWIKLLMTVASRPRIAFDVFRAPRAFPHWCWNPKDYWKQSITFQSHTSFNVSADSAAQGSRFLTTWSAGNAVLS